MSRAGRLSLLHVITGLDVGGAERAMARVVDFARNEGVDSRIVSLGRHGRVADELRRKGFRVDELGIGRGRVSIVGLARFRRIVEQVEPSVVHGWMYHGNLAASFAASTRGHGPVLAWNVRQSLVDIRQERPLTRAVIRLGAWLSARPSGIVYNSARSLEQHCGFGFSRERAEVIPNGFDTDEFAPDPATRALRRAELGVADDSVVVCCVARYHPVKNHKGLLKAMSVVRASCPRVRLLLIGSGLDDSNPEVVSIIERLALQDVVMLLGERDDVAQLLSAADIFCLPSIAEAFPNAVGEAMACGLPCVVSDVGDAPNLVSESGWVVPVGDDDALAGALTIVASLPRAARLEIGARARRRIEDAYSISSVGRRYLEFYRRLTSPKM